MSAEAYYHRASVHLFPNVFQTQSHSIDQQQLREVSGGRLFLSSLLKDHAAVFAGFSSFIKGCSTQINTFPVDVCPMSESRGCYLLHSLQSLMIPSSPEVSVTTLKNNCNEMEFYLWGSKH